MEKFLTKISQSDVFFKFQKALRELSVDNPLIIDNIYGALIAFVVDAVLKNTNRQLLIITPDKDSVEKLYDDYINIFGADGVYLFGERPDPEVQLLDISSPVSQIETLKALSTQNAKVVFASAYSVAEKIPEPNFIKDKFIELHLNTEYDFQKLIDQLEKLNFERKSFVEACGDYAVRGGIIDMFPFAGNNPVRIEFWGNHIESIREFDPISQRSIKELAAASIVSDFLKSDLDNLNSSIFNYLQNDACLLLLNIDLIEKEIDELHNAGVQNIFGWNHIEENISKFKTIISYSIAKPKNEKFNVIDFQSTPQPSFNKSVKIFLQKIEKLAIEGYAIHLICSSEQESKRLEELIQDAIINADENSLIQINLKSLKSVFNIIVKSIHSGFIFPPAKVAVFTEHELFGRILQRSITKHRHFKGISFKELTQLKKGDYVTHIDYGIGIFDGLQKIKIGNIEQEVVRIKYQDNDILFLNLNYVNKIQKYSSREGHIPKLSKLGTKDWENLKLKAKKKIKDIARDLIQLYAKRKSEEGFAFSPDTAWQKELEASFIYEDTPDQVTTTIEVKKDMESSSPMDRLICGDVGFGKTEIAVRAAFKAVMNNKQVAVLVPTTILAEQHYNTFRDRLDKYSVRIESLSRFKSRKGQKKILEDLATGKIDIIIGTHRLLSKDVIFKDLGLLVIDEEHRFGVAAKEKLRMIRSNVDTLTLTATPIPRTLHFSLMGARDLSLISTPPRNRLPIITEIITSTDGKKFNWEILREAILKELHRGGQVYFVHDKVQNIEEIAELIKHHIPEARVRAAHGQMPANQLEKIMLDFLEKKFDVLVSTKIIESGLDIPNVNTIIINRADKFGMAELYQLRGRVGRSNVQAYAYLLTPPLNILPRHAIRRLQAIEEFTELGSGFNLAMRDLEIRGAGNLLGAEQSGFILEMGFETYEQILEQAVRELKNEEFKNIFATENLIESKVETQIDVDIEAYLPEIYIEKDSERLELYRRLYKLDEISHITDIKEELKDRFGDYPEEVENLLKIIEMKILASRQKIERIKIVDNSVTFFLPDKKDESFYGNIEQMGEPLQKFLRFAKQNLDLNPIFKEKNNQLLMEFKLTGNPVGTVKLEHILKILLNFDV